MTISEAKYDMATQWQDLRVHAPISKLYMLQCINKNHPYPCYPAAKHSKHNKLWLQTCEKNQQNFYSAAFAPT